MAHQEPDPKPGDFDAELAAIDPRDVDRSPGNPDGGLVAVVDAHLAAAASHPAGTTDRILGTDRENWATLVDIYGTPWGRVLDGVDPAVLGVSDAPSIKIPDGIPDVDIDTTK